MDTPRTTAKDFFLWAGTVVALYWSIIAYVALVFDYINYSIPNALAYLPSNPYESGISFEMASIIVLLPITLLLRWVIHRDIMRDPSRSLIWVRRWALFLTLFFAGIAMAGDLITLLATFLNGQDITTAFLLKAAVVFLVAAGVFMHFIADLHGYWEQYPSRKRYVVIGVGVLTVVTIIAGFFIVGSPQSARVQRFDTQRVSDLQDLQSRVSSYYDANDELPSTIGDLNSSYSYGPIPKDPVTGAAYEYHTTGDTTFELCATFSAASPKLITTTPTMPGAYGVKEHTWEHGAGRQCFDGEIDPYSY